MSAKQDNNDYRSTVSMGINEARWTFGKVFFPLLGLIFVLSVTGYLMGWFGEATKVAQEEFGPEKALEKYEWFIEQTAGIAKMDQEVENFKLRVQNVDAQYLGYGEKTSWSPDVRMQYNKAYGQASDDLIAIISQRNNLVREYNAASAKFNWAPFKTRPDMPTESFTEMTLQ
jgi:hypothetical protein